MKKTITMTDSQKKGILTGVAIAVLLGVAMFHHCGDNQTMVVDFKRVWQETEAYKTVMNGQMEYNKKLRAQFQVEAEMIRQESQALLKDKAKLGESAFKKKAAAIQEKADQLERRFSLLAQKGDMASGQVLETLKPKAQDIVNSVAKKAGAGVLLNKELALYASDDSDLTDEVVKAMNKKLEPVVYPDPEKILINIKGQ